MGDRFLPVAVIDKMLYDETPLKMKLQESNDFLAQGFQSGLVGKSSVEESYKFAQILRLDWQFASLVFDKYLARHKLVRVRMLTSLLATDRNTSECLVAVIDFAADLLCQLRLPIINRFFG